MPRLDQQLLEIGAGMKTVIAVNFASTVGLRGAKRKLDARTRVISDSD